MYMKITTVIAMILACGVSHLNALDKPDVMLAKRMKTPLLQVEGQMTGEGVCWHAKYKSGDFVKAYEATGDVEYIRAAFAYCDALIAKMYTSPDGYKGFVGPNIGNAKRIQDVHVGDAILYMLFLSVAEIAYTDEKLKEEFAPKIQEYLEMTKVHLFEKWHKRGTWWQNGPYGGYFCNNKFLTVEKMDEFQINHGIYGTIGYQFNKQLDMAACHLRYYRLTGDLEQREMAMRIYNHSKARLNLVDDHYVWNYWEPFYPRDLVRRNQLGLWVATHPYRNYQKGEVHLFIEAFHSGLCFNAEDIKRLVQTNKHMYKGVSEKNGKQVWFNSNNYAVEKATGEPKEFIPSKAYPTKAGALWPGLAEFDEEIARLAGVEATNTAYKRKYSDLPVTIFEVPFSNCANINMVGVLPAATTYGGYVQLFSKLRVPGKVRVTLHDEAGVELKELFNFDHEGGNDGQEGIAVKDWVVDVEKGTYRVRWQEGEEYRDYMIYVDHEGPKITP